MLKSGKTLALLAVILLTGLVAIQAQDEETDRRDMRQKFRSEHKEQMQKFHVEEVEPVLKKMKAKFDAAISQEDLAKLNELRNKAAKLRNAHLAERKKYREMVKNNPDSCFCQERKERRANAKKHRAEMQQLHDELQPIADKYETILSKIHESFENDLRLIKEKRQKLRQDMREDFRSEFRKDGRRGGRGNGNKGFGRRGNRGGNHGDGMMMSHNPERFLLWDGQSRADLDK